MEPLMGGKLASPPEKVQAVFDRVGSGRAPAQWALDFLWDKEAVSVVLSGMSAMQQVKDNVAYADEAAVGMLTETERETCAEAKEQFDALIAVPCTGCGYCVPCPSGVNIPRNFSAFNDLKAYDSPEVGRASFSRMMFIGGKQTAAASCKSCRVCEKKCPQQIEISRFMPQVAQAFEDMI
jgi:predicted aldo/keto reductase-like oxidoreductase